MSDNVTAGGGGNAFSRLSSREQIMVAVLGVVVTLLLLAGITFAVSRTLDRAERRLNERREQLVVIEALEGKYRAAETEQALQRSKLQRSQVQLFSLLQKSASELGLKLDNLNERRSSNKEAGVDEVSVDVALKEMSITKLNKFLEKMEGPPNTGLVKVTKLKVKTGFANEDLLDVNMTVSTYRAQAGATATAADEPAPLPGEPHLPGDEPLPELEGAP